MNNLCKFIDNDIIDYPIDGITDWIEVSSVRQIELDNGANPTDEEYEEFYQARINEFKHDGDTKGFYTIKIEYEGAYIFVFYSEAGHSFNDLEYEFAGVFRSIEDGIENLFENGVLIDASGMERKV